MLLRFPDSRIRRACARAGHGLLLLAAGAAFAQSPAPAAAPAPEGSDEAIVARLTRLRDDFMQGVSASGFKPCKAPAIALGDPPSFGHYEPRRNAVLIGAWTRLSASEKEGFEEMAKRMGGDADARTLFENGTYRWVYVHELAHWWQSCRHKVRPGTWAEESGASRIALAYWHVRDPHFASGIVRGFRSLVSSTPSPVPQGQTPQQYLDANFTKIARGEAYAWFQGQMVVELTQAPPPTFHDALAQPLYPR